MLIEDVLSTIFAMELKALLDINKQLLIRRLSNEGLSQREIAKQTGISRTTIRSYISDPERGKVLTRQKSKNPRRISVMTQGNQEMLKNDYIKSGYNSVILSKFLYEEPAKYGLPEGFNLHVRSIRRYMNSIVEKPRKTTYKVINRYEVEVGQQLQIDFTHGKYFFDGDKNASSILIFEAVYTWSHKQFFWICPDMSQASWLRAISECLLNFGIPREILCDNDKSLVLSNDGPNKVRFHPDFLFFCKHFGISPRACKPRRPQTKGAVERAGYYLKKTGFRWASIKYPHIKSVEELNSAIQEWTRTFSDVDRSFDSMIDKVQKLRTPKELYEYEKKFLSFVDREKFTIPLSCKMLRVKEDGELHVHGHAIRLPAKYASKSVLVVVCANGEFRISNSLGDTLAEGYFTKDQLSRYSIDAEAEEAINKPSENNDTKQSTKNDYDEFFAEYDLNNDDF